MTCLSCRYSIHKDGQLWCSLWEGAADWRCNTFIYEPGTDEVEHDTDRNDPRPLARG